MMTSQYFGGIFPFMDPFFGAALLPLVIVISVWTIAIKGYALWHAARNTQKIWFVALLVVNTLGILELVYLIWFRTKQGPVTTVVPTSTSSSGEAS